MKTIYTYILSALLSTILFACGTAHTHDKDAFETTDAHNHAYSNEQEPKHDLEHEHSAAGNEIALTSQQTIEAGITTEEVKPAYFHQIIKTGGQILSAQGDEVTVSATINGIVSFSKTSLNEGAAVKAGETLISISSRTLGEGDPLLKARSAYNAAKQEFDRAESLIGDKLISQKDYNQIKLNYENAKVTLDALGRNRSAQGAGITSTISGFVKSRFVSEGQYVEMGQPLLTITKNRRLQLRADVSERYYGDLNNITSANFKTPYRKEPYKLADLNGKLISYGKSASDLDYYIPVNFEFDNIGQMVSGAYVEIFLLSKPKSNVISVPLTALIEEQGVYFVYIRLDEEHYQKREVKLGQNDGERVEVLSGLNTGEQVVCKGAHHIRLASASGAIPHGHEH